MSIRDVSQTMLPIIREVAEFLRCVDTYSPIILDSVSFDSWLLVFLRRSYGSLRAETVCCCESLGGRAGCNAAEVYFLAIRLSMGNL